MINVIYRFFKKTVFSLVIFFYNWYLSFRKSLTLFCSKTSVRSTEKNPVQKSKRLLLLQLTKERYCLFNNQFHNEKKKLYHFRSMHIHITNVNYSNRSIQNNSQQKNNVKISKFKISKYRKSTCSEKKNYFLHQYRISQVL